MLGSHQIKQLFIPPGLLFESYEALGSFPMLTSVDASELRSSCLLLKNQYLREVNVSRKENWF